MKTVLIVLVCLFAGCTVLGVGGLVTLGVLAENHVIPDTVACPGSELRQPDVDWLREVGYLPRGESIVYFYSNGFLSIEEEGNFFTESRVVSYFQDYYGRRVHEYAELSEVADVDARFEGGFLANSVITITRDDGSQFELLVSNDQAGDRIFYDELIRRWHASR